MSDLFIDGVWSTGNGSSFESTNPADGSLLWQGNSASNEQVDQAIASAHRSFQPWADLPTEDRKSIVLSFAQYLEQHRDELAGLISREVGKPLWEAKTEVAASIAKASVSIAAIESRRSHRELEPSAFRVSEKFRPLGVMLVLGPFNFPAHLPGGQIIPALLAGNSVVFKPSELTPAVGQWLVKAWEASGLPAGTVNLVHGGPDVATAAIDNDQTAGVLFTGSYRAGCAIHRRLAGRPEVLLALEMGGNNPLVVLDSKPTNAAISLTIQSAYISAGQRCTCARRLVVIDSEANREFVDRLLPAIKQIHCTLPDGNPAPFIGPLISQAAAYSVIDTQDGLIASGGKVLVRSERSSDSPAIVTPGLVDVTNVDVSDTECFGPLLQLHWAKDFEDAITVANNTRFGLAAGLVGGDQADFDHFRSSVRAGVINWNRQTTGASGQLAFGGLDSSGNHRPAGYHAADFCSDPVSSLESEHLELPETLPPGLHRIFEQ